MFCHLSMYFQPIVGRHTEHFDTLSCLGRRLALKMTAIFDIVVCYAHCEPTLAL